MEGGSRAAIYASCFSSIVFSDMIESGFKNCRVGLFKMFGVPYDLRCGHSHGCSF